MGRKRAGTSEHRPYVQPGLRLGSAWSSTLCASVCPGSNARALETVLQPEGDRMFHFYDGHHFLGMHLLWWIFWIGFIVLAFGVFQPVRRTRG